MTVPDPSLVDDCDLFRELRPSRFLLGRNSLAARACRAVGDHSDSNSLEISESLARRRGLVDALKIDAGVLRATIACPAYEARKVLPSVAVFRR